MGHAREGTHTHCPKMGAEDFRLRERRCSVGSLSSLVNSAWGSSHRCDESAVRVSGVCVPGLGQASPRVEYQQFIVMPRTGFLVALKKRVEISFFGGPCVRAFAPSQLGRCLKNNRFSSNVNQIPFESVQKKVFLVAFKEGLR